MPEPRPVRPEDAPALVDLFGALAEGDGTEEHWDLEDVEQELGSALIEPSRDWLVVEHDGALVASSMLLPRAPAGGEHPVGVVGGVHPAHRRAGLGTDLLRRMVSRASAYVAERGEHRTVVRVQGLSDDRDLAALLGRLGLEPEHWTYEMEADLASVAGEGEPALPEGYTLSTWEGVGAEELRTTHNTAFREHRGWSPWDARMWQEYVEDNRAHRPAESLVARDGSGGIAAYVHVAEYVAIAQATGVREVSVLKVGTLPGHRRRGLGTALLQVVLARGRRDGYHRAGLEVDAHNETGALSVYEAAGFAVARRWTNYAGRF